MLAEAPIRASFGPTADDWTARFPASLPLVASDFGSVHLALADAAQRRKAGERFIGSVLMDDSRARCALYVAAPTVLAQVVDPVERATMLDAVSERRLSISGRPQVDYERYDGRYVRTAIEFLSTADAVAVRSEVERERLCATLSWRFGSIAAAAPLDPAVPEPGERRAPHPTTIVVWAPQLPAEACGLFAFALESSDAPVVIICSAGQPASMRAQTRFVAFADAGAVLARAVVIVDASLSDPGTSRALARWGVPLAGASCAGASDWLDGLAVFEPWNHRSITTAVNQARQSAPPRERRRRDEIAELQMTLAHASQATPADGPLVSVIVCTLNRRPSLSAALESIAAQTYRNFEIVVVNDGGPPIERTHYGSTELRLVEYPDNRGVIEALNIGVEAARGKYIALLADDDLFCHDHLALLVAPLERIGGHVAHAIELVEHFELESDGSQRCIGHSMICGQPATPSGLHVGNFIGGPSILFSREAYMQVGPFESRAAHLCDLEMWLRLAKVYDFLHVPRITAIMSMRDDASQISAIGGPQTAAFYQNIYALHPTDRAALRRMRDNHLIVVEAIDIVRTLPQLRLDG